MIERLAATIIYLIQYHDLTNGAPLPAFVPLPVEEQQFISDTMSPL
jgi:hypothetical protein